MAEQLYRRCYMCSPAIGFVDPDCESCRGTGRLASSRVEAMFRDKEYLGVGHPDADANGYEKFVRFVAEVPPEVAEAVKRAQRKSLGVSWDGWMSRPTSATRANAVRSGLLKYMDAADPEPAEAIDVECVEVTASDLPEG